MDTASTEKGRQLAALSANNLGAVIGAAAIAVGFQIPTKLRPFFNYVTKPVGAFEALFQEG